MDRYEYRVVWQREPDEHGTGGARRYQRFDSEDAARRKALRLQGRLSEAYGVGDPDAAWCCEGYSCPCGGESYGERDARVQAELRPLTLLRIDGRPVGDWQVTP